jgi:hypothetical protein
MLVDTVLAPVQSSNGHQMVGRDDVVPRALVTFMPLGYELRPPRHIQSSVPLNSLSCSDFPSILLVLRGPERTADTTSAVDCALRGESQNFTESLVHTYRYGRSIRTCS